MANTRWAVPWQPEIPFHVRVISEQFAIRVKGNVILVPKATSNEFKFFAFRIGFADPASGGF